MKPLLILDIDETLIHTEVVYDDEYSGEYDFVFDTEEDDENFYVLMRPYLKEFLGFAFDNFDVAIWTAATRDYAELIFENIGIDISKFIFFYSRENCGMKMDYETGTSYGVKNLNKLRKRVWARKYGRELERVLIIDDIAETAVNNYGNLIKIKPFEFDRNDIELLKLSSYLEKIKNEPNFRRINKRNWDYNI